MKVKIVKRKNPQNKEEQKFYAQPVKLGMKDTNDLCEEIAGRCSLTKGDVLNVFSNLGEVAVKWLIEGYSVKLNDLGTMRVTLRSKGADAAPEDISSLVSRARVRFQGDRTLLKEVNTDIRYETSASVKV